MAGASAQGAGAGARVGDGATALRRQSSFSYAFTFLPEAQRRALDAVYAFCRLADDAVDDAGPGASGRARLDRLGRVLDAIYEAGRGDAGAGSLDAEGVPPPDPELDEIEAELFAAVRRFPIRKADLAAVLEGCAWDLERTRYASWPELRDYCLRVASAVGLASIEVFGYREPAARDYAIELGIAMQLTNVLRDVDEDAARGRIYLPSEDLRAFAVSEDDLLSRRRTGGVLRLLGFEAQRARAHFEKARAALGGSERAHLVVAEIMADLYSALLDELERRGFPAGQRITLSPERKAEIAQRRFAASRTQGGH